MTTSVRRIGRYTIEGVVGTGAFATVYRALDESLAGPVAVKVLADNHCLDPDIRARFLDEGRALRRIDSPHVLRVYDVGETDQLQPYLVLEFADRGTLAARVAGLRASGWQPGVADVGALVASLAGAVMAVHTAQLVHRDLSPGNVLLRSAGAPSGSGSAPSGSGSLVGPGERLVVADLGLAKDLARNSGLTVAGGTDGFRPPEQRGGPARVDGRADVWALSAVLVWLLTGKAPGTPGVVVDRRVVDQALAELGLPAGLRAPVLKSLAEDPGDRHPDVASWRADVEAALVPKVAAPVRPAAASSSPSRRRPRWVDVGLVVAGLAVGVLAAFLLLPDDDDPAGPVTSTKDLDDGRVEVSASDEAGEARLTLVGPDDANVGDTVPFEAQADAVDEWAWFMPDGTIYPNQASVQLTASSEGTAEVVLIGVADSGELLQVVHRLRVAQE